MIFFSLIARRFPCKDKRQKLAQNSFLSQWNVQISLMRFKERNKGSVCTCNAADLWGTFQVDVNEPTVDLRFWLAPPHGTPPRNKNNGHWWPTKRLQVLIHTWLSHPIRLKYLDKDYFINAWYLFSLATISNFSVRWCEIWSQEILGVWDSRKALGISDRLPSNMKWRIIRDTSGSEDFLVPDLAPADRKVQNGRQSKQISPINIKVSDRYFKNVFFWISARTLIENFGAKGGRL